MSDDLFETELEHRLKSGGSKKGGSKRLAAAGVISLVVAMTYFMLWPMAQSLFSGAGKSQSNQNQAFSTVASDEDIVKRQLTSFVEQFLMAYYNYSYTLYDGKVREAEAMMTPAFQAKYSVQARNLDFKRKLDANKVSTDAIRILPNSFLFQQEGNRYFVKLSGVMTFTTGINAVSGEFPINLLLAIDRSDTGFLVDNVERTR